jgi:DNA (cytosine-5)-methyltransferase 1
MPRSPETARPILDLFAGPGGWGEGLRRLGHEARGIDSDPLACATAEAAGHERLLADIAALDPGDFPGTWGLVASPPCQAYSRAGKGLGALDKPSVLACARELSEGVDSRAGHRARCTDERSLLTVEPLRWALALRPRWLALEQVPAVVELWSAFADLLGDYGYRCAAGLLSAERFGVPQVRKRAFLIGSLDGAVDLPAPTHRSFDPRRHGPREDELHLPRWRSMAEALGWGHERARLRRDPVRPGRSLDSPSESVAAGSVNWHIESLPDWTRRRPATTLLGDPRITAPGSWPRCGRRAEIVRGRPVRVTVGQAGVLQGFRHDYPWQGCRSRRFAQIGNAVPPPLAARIAAEAMRPTLEANRGHARAER